MISKEQILQLLDELNVLAEQKGVLLEIDLYGGCAMLLAYDLRAATQDVDAVVRPESEAQQFIRTLAKRHQLEENWLNSDVAQFLSPLKESKRPLEPHPWDHLRVSIPTARYLLAMKAMACREPIGRYEGDFGDLRYLIRKMNIRDVDSIQTAIDTYYPDDPLDDRRRNILSDLIEQAHD